MAHDFLILGGFIIIILFILFLDLGLFTKRNHAVTFKESIGWTVLWISLAVGFFLLLRSFGYFIHGIENYEQLAEVIQKYNHSIDISGLTFAEAISVYNKNLSLEYLTGYIIEYSLSVDNVFVILMIFVSFGVQQEYYKKVLFWGILGAVVMRFIFIFLLSALITKFDWILIIFGGILLFTVAKMLWDIIHHKEERIDPEKHPVVRFSARYFNVYPKYVEHRFLVREGGRLFITPLLVVLLVIEFSDVIFAVDSVPAIFSVTKDPHIVFYSNIFAIIGLRSLFFLISNIVNIFHYLKYGLLVLLAFIGVKLILHNIIEISTVQSLVIVSLILAASILLSVVMRGRREVR